MRNDKCDSVTHASHNERKALFEFKCFQNKSNFAKKVLTN